MVLLLLVLTISWQALRSDKLILGGIALGIAICLKIVAWPLVILLALRKKWQAVISAGVTVLTVNLIIALTLGFNVVLYYYQHVAGQVYPFWRSSGYNISVVSLGWKLFAGTSSLQPAALNAPPLIPMPGIAPYASGVMLLVVLIGGLAVARKRSFDVAFGMMACVSAIISPIAWDHYLVLAVIAISAAVKSLALLHYPKDQVKIASLLFLLLIIPIFPQRSLAVSLLGKDAVAGGNHWALIPLAWSGFIPLVASLALIWFMNRLDQQVEKACSGPADSRLGCESEVRRPERC
jgi:hypothetical protein